MNETERQELIELASHGTGVYKVEIVVTAAGSLAVMGSRRDSLYDLLPESHQRLIDLIIKIFTQSAEQAIKEHPDVAQVRCVLDEHGYFDNVLDAKVIDDNRTV